MKKTFVMPTIIKNENITGNYFWALRTEIFG